MGTSMARGAEPLLITAGEDTRGAKQPQVAIGPDGAIHLVCSDGEAVFYCRSDDKGLTFSPPREAIRVEKIALGMRRGPRLAATDKAIVISAIGSRLAVGLDGELQAWRSTDGGKSWQGSSTVNDVTRSAREGLHAMCAAPDGSVWCAWLDLRSRKMEIYASRSGDGGESWSKNVLVYHSPGGSVCECCHPSVTADRTGRIRVLFRNSLDGNRDMYLATSSDGGQTFADATKLGLGAWKLKACPMDGGMIAVDASGMPLSVWRRDKTVFLTSGAVVNEQTLAEGQQPWIASTSRGPVVAWTSGRQGDLWAKLPTSEMPIKLAADARDPVVAASGDFAIVAWQGQRNDRAVVYTMRVEVAK